MACRSCHLLPIQNWLAFFNEDIRNQFHGLTQIILPMSHKVSQKELESLPETLEKLDMAIKLDMDLSELPCVNLSSLRIQSTLESRAFLKLQSFVHLKEVRITDEWVEQLRLPNLEHLHRLIRHFLICTHH